MMKYFLVDANIVAAYYLPRSMRNPRTANVIEQIFNHIRNHQDKYFIYIPNFCIAETVSVFIKHSFADWNEHVKKPIDTRVYKRLVGSFQQDIHNGKFMYHLELNRYHVLGINLVAPIDHYYQMSKSRTKPNVKKKRINPAGTFDQLIISMGIQLSKIHGNDAVCILTTDNRLSRLLKKCKSNLKRTVLEKMKITIAEELCGVEFSKDLFPQHLNLNESTDETVLNLLGVNKLDIKPRSPVYRYLS